MIVSMLRCRTFFQEERLVTKLCFAIDKLKSLSIDHGILVKSKEMPQTLREKPRKLEKGDPDYRAFPRFKRFKRSMIRQRS